MDSNTDRHGNIRVNVNLNTQPDAVMDTIRALTERVLDALDPADAVARINAERERLPHPAFADPGVGAADPDAPQQRGVLPVRAHAQSHPDTDARRDGLALPERPDVDDALTGPDTFVHSHRHLHRAQGLDDYIARTGLVVDSYTHTHRHGHDGAIPDDRTYHTDHTH